MIETISKSPRKRRRARFLADRRVGARRARSAAGGLGGRCWRLRFSAAAAAAGSAVGVVSFVGLPTRRRLGFVAISGCVAGMRVARLRWCGRVPRRAARVLAARIADLSLNFHFRQRTPPQMSSAGPPEGLRRALLGGGNVRAGWHCDLR